MDYLRGPGLWTALVKPLLQTIFVDHSENRILVVCMIELLTVRGKMCMSRVLSLDMIVETQCEVLNPFTI